jgi:hypothetical protein
VAVRRSAFAGGTGNTAFDEERELLRGLRLVVHPINELDILNACNFKAVRRIGLCGGLEMMDICERSAGGRLENANQFAGCTT